MDQRTNGRAVASPPESQESLRDRLIGQGMKALLKTAAALPIDVASDLGARILSAMMRGTQHHDKAARHVRIAFPDMDDAQVERIVCGMWDHLGRNLGEFPHITDLATMKARVEIVNPEALVRIHAQGKGGLILNGHIGNWEVGAPAMMSMGCPCSIVYLREAFVGVINDYIESVRAKVAVDQIAVKGGAAAKMRQAFAEKKYPAILMDRYDPRGVPAKFFGRLTRSTRLPIELALEAGVPIIMGTAIRLGGARFRLLCGPVLVPDPALDLAANADRLLQQYTEQMEAWIREYPDQYLWVHRRWPE